MESLRPAFGDTLAASLSRDCKNCDGRDPIKKSGPEDRSALARIGRPGSALEDGTRTFAFAPGRAVTDRAFLRPFELAGGKRGSSRADARKPASLPCMVLRWIKRRRPSWLVLQERNKNDFSGFKGAAKFFFDSRRRRFAFASHSLCRGAD